jgi:hypothetical protein
LNSDINQGGTLIPISTVYSTEFYQGERNNEIYSLEDSRFTKYQAATIRFNYTDATNLAIGSQAKFQLHLNYQPNIYEMQNLLLADDTRLACADYLIKAVVPCMVSLNINLVKNRPTDTYESLNIQQLKKDLFTYVNSIPFGEELHASNIVDICHNYDIKRVDLPISMLGVILCPDGSTIELSDSDVLTIPNEPAKGVTPKTTQYFIDYYRVSGGVANTVDNIGFNIA